MSPPKKLLLFFAKISLAIFLGGGEFSSTLQPDSQRPLGPIPTFLFPGCVMGKVFWEKSSASPDFAPRDGPPTHKV